MTGAHVTRGGEPHRLAQAALGAIALDRAADLPGGGETGAYRPVNVAGARTHLNHDGGPGLTGAVAGA